MSMSAMPCAHGARQSRACNCAIFSGQVCREASEEAEHLLVPEEEAFALAVTTALDSPVEVLDSLLFVLSPMLETILTMAMERAYAVRSLRPTLSLERGEPHAISIRPATPSQNRDALLKLLNLELQAKPPQAGVVTVTLEAEPSRPQTSQRGLFQAQLPEPDKLDLLLARLRSIAGEENVGAPTLENSHREDAFTLSTFEPTDRRGDGGDQSASAPCHAGVQAAASGPRDLLRRPTTHAALARHGCRFRPVPAL